MLAHIAAPAVTVIALLCSSSEASVMTPLGMTRTLRVNNGFTFPPSLIDEMGPALGAWTRELRADNVPGSPNYNPGTNLTVLSRQSSNNTPTQIEFTGAVAINMSNISGPDNAGGLALATCFAQFSLSDPTEFSLATMFDLTAFPRGSGQERRLVELFPAGSTQAVFRSTDPLTFPLPAVGTLPAGTYELQMTMQVLCTGRFTTNGFAFGLTFSVPEPPAAAALLGGALLAGRRRRAPA